MALPKLGEKENFVRPNCGNVIAENREKKKVWDPNCGNVIAEIGRKKIVLAIVAMALPKMEKKKICFGNCGNGIAENGEKKCCEICERVKEKLSRPQYFHNKSHVINYY